MSSRHAGLQKIEISLYINLRNKESCCCLTWQPRNQLLGTETVELFCSITVMQVKCCFSSLLADFLNVLSKISCLLVCDVDLYLG